MGSAFSSLVKPVYQLFGWLLAGSYAAVPNYAIAIAIITLIVLLPFTPLIAKSIRANMAMQDKMQRVNPEMKRIRELYKDDSMKRNEELQALMKREGFNPAGGCLPMLPQMAVLWVFFAFIERGVYHYVGSKTSCNISGSKPPCISPQNIPLHTHLLHDLVATNGHLQAFGMDLSQKILAHRPILQSIPYWIVLVVGGGVQYVQTQRMMSRSPQTPQMQQMQMMNRILPLFFVMFYFIIPMAVCIYYMTSALIRLVQYEYVYLRHPDLHVHRPPTSAIGKFVTAKIGKAPPERARPPAADDPGGVGPDRAEVPRRPERPGGGAGVSGGEGTADAGQAGGGGNTGKSGPGPGVPPRSVRSSVEAGKERRTGQAARRPPSPARPKQHPRSKSKRRRKAR